MPQRWSAPACALALLAVLGCGGGDAASNGTGQGAGTVTTTWTPGVEYFVSPEGSDSNPGTMARPFATLDRALDAVKTLEANGLPAGGVAVTLRGGIYRRTSTLTLDAAASGTSTRPVVWRAYPGETPRISGGRRVTGWSAVTSSDVNWSRIHAPATLYRADLGLASYGALTDSAFAELFYQGAPMLLGRWPEGSSPAGMTTSGGSTLTSTTALPHDWSAALSQPAPNRPVAHVFTNGFQDWLFQVTGLGANTVTLDGALPPLDPNLGSELAWQAINLLEEVSDPGEYWIDRVAGVAYFRPPDDQNPDVSGAEVIVSELADVLVDVRPSASYIQLQGLVFEHDQNDLVRVSGSNVTFSGCTLRNASHSGVLVSGSGDAFDHDVLYALGSLGISVEPGSSGVTISNTDIHDVARHLHNGNAAIYFGGSHQTIRNNALHELPWSAIFVDPGARDSLIELNDVYATQQAGSDVHAIYAAMATDAGIEIRYNYVHDVPRPSWPWNTGADNSAINLDTDAGLPDISGFDIHGNVFHRLGDGTATDPLGAGLCAGVVNKGNGNTIANNLFMRVDVPYVQGEFGSASTAGNQSWFTRLPLGTQADPGVLDEATGDMANRPDGTLVLSGRSEIIPFSQIGIH